MNLILIFMKKIIILAVKDLQKLISTTNITDNTLFKIETDRNLKTDLTNSHKLAIENENECIRYGLYLQRNYFSR